MGKRSDFPRVERDCYDTPPEAVLPLLPHLPSHVRFIDPCAGNGALFHCLEDAGHKCVAAYDVAPRGPGIETRSLFDISVNSAVNCGADGFITNPPWTRQILHPMIECLLHFEMPFWLLIDANWMFTAQAAPYLNYCGRIVTIGRVKWIPGTTMTGKDDCAWFYFESEKVKQTIFHGSISRGRRETAAA